MLGQLLGNANIPGQVDTEPKNLVFSWWLPLRLKSDSVRELGVWVRRGNVPESGGVGWIMWGEGGGGHRDKPESRKEGTSKDLPLSPSMQYKTLLLSSGISDFVGETAKSGLWKWKLQSIDIALEAEKYYLHCYSHCTGQGKVDPIFPRRLKPATGILTYACLFLHINLHFHTKSC